MDDSPILYMLVTNDRFELPLCVAENSGELSRYIGLAQSARVAGRLVQSPDGIVHTMDRRFKYMRIDASTGEIFVGKLPKEIASYCQNTGSGRLKAVICEKNGAERRFLSASEAARETGINLSTIYAALRTGRRSQGYKWRYA